MKRMNKNKMTSLVTKPAVFELLFRGLNKIKEVKWRAI
jgi:hypothetical protein